MRVNLPLLFGLMAAFPAAASPQARIAAIDPETAGILIQRLGSDADVVAKIGMELMPGDMIRGGDGGPALELACGESGATVTYMIESPFRVLIDVPTVASCHVDLLSGTTDVVAEAPTETSAGGVTLGSSGTQYAVELNRDGDTVLLNCIVYDDTVRVLTRAGLQAVAGSKLVWNIGRGVRLAANSPTDLSRSAATYARFDLAASEKAGARVDNRNAALRVLTRLHYEVLANPSDTASRVNLAKEQIRYGIKDQASYNLKSVDITTDAQLQRYQIDPATVRGNLVDPSRQPGGSIAVSPATRAAIAVATPTTDTDLRLIAGGRIDEAIRNLDARVSAGNATSRDYFALARAWSQKGDPARARANAGRALVLHANDNRLSAAELRQLGELIARLS